MLTFILSSGPFGILALLSGLVGLGLVLSELLTQGRRSFRRQVAIAALVAFLIGVFGSAFGGYLTSRAVLGAPEELQATLWYSGMGIALSTTTIGSAVALANIAALGVLRLVVPGPVVPQA